MRGTSLLLTSRGDRASNNRSWKSAVDSVASKSPPLCCAFLRSRNSLLALCGTLLSCFSLLFL